MKRKKHHFPDNRTAAFVLASGPKSAPCPVHPAMDPDNDGDNDAAAPDSAAPAAAPGSSGQ